MSDKKKKNNKNNQQQTFDITEGENDLLKVVFHVFPP